MTGPRELEVPRERGDPLRVRQRDLDGGGPGELQGAAHPGTEPELEDHLERQPLGNQLPRVLRPGVLTREQPVHVLAAVQVGRDDGGQPLGRARLGDHVRDQVVQVRRTAAIVQDRRDERAEGEGVGAAGDEPGAVRRVLHRVVEQQRLALRVLELPAGEQLGDGDRGQAGQARAEEPGAVVHPARRAPVMLGGVDAILVVPDVAEHRYVDDVTAEVLGGVQRADAVTGGVEHEDGDRAGLAGRAGGDLFVGRGDQRPDQALAGHRRAVDLRRVRHQLLRVLLRGKRRPSGTAAVTAVHGGQRLAGDPALGGLRLRARLPEPGEPRVRADDPEQPAERPDPQVRLDMQERPGHVVRVPGLREQRDEPRERGRRLLREAPERLTPVVGTLPGQQVQHLAGCGRPVAEHVHQRVREDVSPQHPPEFRRVGDLLAGDELGDLRHRLVVHTRVAQPREFLRRRERKRVVDLAEELLGGQPLLGDHRVLAERGAEDLLGDLPDAFLVPALPQRGGCRDRADVSERLAGL